jgi:hypothetical protein
MTKRLSLTFTYLSLGAFFVALGVAGIMPGIDEGMFNLRADYPVEVAFGVVELIAGVYLILGRFAKTTRRATFLASFVILCFWILRIAISRLVFGMGEMQSNFLGWLVAVTCELAIASSLGLLLKAND